MDKEGFQSRLLNWYELNKRGLPWRDTKDPYKIWVSEIILQQTRVNQGLPYYNKFIEKYPTVNSMAAAPEEEILRAWQGLGYYSRARNMWATAKYIANDLKKFPDSYNALLKLKGIGTYTAAAIASFAFGERIAVIDGNVYRVLARIFGIKTDISSGVGKKEFTKLANDLIDQRTPGLYNQAIMDFGAVICTPSSPLCDDCPFNDFCFARKNNLQKELPVKIKTLKIKEIYFQYFVFDYKGKFGMKLRTGNGIWKGLYDFYLVEYDKNPPFQLDSRIEEILSVSTVHEGNEIFIHQLTHRKIFARFTYISINETSYHYLKENFEINFYSPSEIENLPKPTLIVNYLQSLKKI